MSATREHDMFDPKMEAISRDELHALQSERLRWTVKHEYDNVPVYRARMISRAPEVGQGQVTGAGAGSMRAVVACFPQADV